MLERWIKATPETSFEIPAVSEELYMQTREALAKEGYTFVVAIEPLSIGQLVSDPVKSQRFDYVDPSENIGAIVAPQMEVAIDPTHIRIESSNHLSTDKSIEEIKQQEAALKARLPQEVRNLISMRIQNASVLAQLDDQYQKETGKVLFTDWHGRTDDRTVRGLDTGVGRNGRTAGLRVNGWLVGGDWPNVHGHDPIFAVLIVVLPRKLAEGYVI